MATFTWIPSFGSPESSSPRVVKTAMGDGYEQRIKIGINTDPKSWDLRFNNRTDSEREAILAFLEARGGSERFDWTTPRGGTGKKWVCADWSFEPTTFNNNQLSAKFRQVFEY